ncbi:jg25305 [Pararge aegeria aegeria]|uniref:Jg25305 protein n=1 Tax=Pararge aegeria aegeria TaxID=348720 RepID=A0A8S4S8T3_9NEOP|nr:jg25305 [Pararge aegeria aegeria]
MKNKLGNDFGANEKFVSDLPMNVEEQIPKTTSRRESIPPKIVVCPPVEESSEAVTTTRGTRLLKALSKRLSRRSADGDSLGSSSSNDSMSCETGRTDGRSSSSASDSGSDNSERPRRHRSTVSLRRVFQNLNLTSRSHSSSPTERHRQPKKQSQPKRILRSPVTYTYVRGLSGLPTQRVPRHTVGLNR